MKKSYKIKIEPLTAVHVGTGNELLPTDYTVVPSPNNAAVKKYVKFSSDKIIDKILSSGTPQQKVEMQKACDSNDINQLAKFFNKYFYFGVDYDANVTRDFSTLHSKKIGQGLFENSLAVNEMLHHANKPYIPGSSIKGAIRTAILNQILLKDMSDDEYEKLADFADEEKQRDFKKAAKYEKQIQEKALSMLKVSGIDSAKLDPFRCLEISDCEFSAKNQIVGKMRNAKIDKFKKELVFNDMQIIAEAISGKLMKKENSSEFQLRINEDLQNVELSNGFCINMQIDLEKIVSACNFFFKKEFNEEYQKFYKDAYDGVDEIFELKKIIDSISENSKNQFLIRVGRWSQVESVTLGNDFRNPKTPTKNGKVMPCGTSRTVFNYDGQYLPMGWCKCTVEEDK